MSTTTAADVLNDIEFELLQGTVERNELGQGIQATRQFQNEIRATTLQSAASAKLEVSDLVGRQFQINDMILSLFQATDMKLSGLQSELHRAAYLKLHESRDEVDVGDQSATLNAYDVDDLSLQSQNWTTGYVDDGADGDLAEVIDEDVLTVSMHVRPVRIPLVGWLLSCVSQCVTYVDALLCESAWARADECKSYFRRTHSPSRSRQSPAAKPDRSTQSPGCSASCHDRFLT